MQAHTTLSEIQREIEALIARLGGDTAVVFYTTVKRGVDWMEYKAESVNTTFTLSKDEVVISTVVRTI